MHRIKNKYFDILTYIILPIALIYYYFIANKTSISHPIRFVFLILLLIDILSFEQFKNRFKK
ncbi:hypothetical protein SAMN05446037_10428 [Anaerovirgula multivorans]|uniref:Uncharacterized protein n=1 Tax=Anaerovirgula multivorans TaxID=312168 RepID=A0A239K4Z8_9FIRM|nr:hypothetical protein SAMN05446037_10428 [Anaerovirgula multivorans]